MRAAAYIPAFQYDKDAPSAREILHRFTHLFRFLPEKSRQPSLASRMLRKVIVRSGRRWNGSAPRCSLHEIPMVLLGKREWELAKVTQKRTLDNAGTGKIPVREGLFRCPVPGCVRCADFTDEKGTFTTVYSDRRIKGIEYL